MKKTGLVLLFFSAVLLGRAQEAPAKTASKKPAPASVAPSHKYENSEFGPGHNRRRAKMRKRSRYI